MAGAVGLRTSGLVSYDWIDNRRIPSADRVIPELQHLKVRDPVPTGERGGFTVESLEVNRSLLLVIRDEGATISSSILLTKPGEQQTRMIMRLKCWFRPGLRQFLYYLVFEYLVFEPGDFVMMRKMMLGIKTTG